MAIRSRRSLLLRERAANRLDSHVKRSCISGVRLIATNRKSKTNDQKDTKQPCRASSSHDNPFYRGSTHPAVMAEIFGFPILRWNSSGGRTAK